MGEVRNGEQKVHKCLYSEIFYGGQKVYKYLCLNFSCTSRGSLYSLVAWNEPFIHFATVQLVRGATEKGENSPDCKPQIHIRAVISYVCVCALHINRLGLNHTQ